MTALPINVEELLKGLIVEWERLEFKKGWNPEEVIHTICAFANDINNWGGGYLIIGIEEDNGQPIFPPVGISAHKIDEIQKELVNLSYRLRPNYHPIVSPVIFQEKMILLIWCPGGQTRPYQAPETLGKNAPYSYYIRRNSTTVKAQTKDVQRLHEMANQVPFDDRIRHQADLKDLKIGLIKDFLRDVNSDLLNEVDNIPFDKLCRQMQIAQGPEEYLKPLNIGLMMFNANPEQYFPYARIEIVYFHDEVGDSFSETIFKGPIHIQLKEALRYLKTMFIKEEIRKRPDRAEADRFYNYPYIALEETLANAVYHKDYAQREPIEIRIRTNRIEVLSFPGPLPPLKIDDLNKGSAHIRTYRNRRIGDFLKELHLTEGRCTGVPKIHKAMKKNGSPPAIFKTDEECSYFLTILPIHPEAIIKTGPESGITPVEAETHQLTGVLPAETHQLTGVLPAETHQLTGVLPGETHQLTGVLPGETHQLTGVLPGETHQLTGVLSYEEIPKEIQLLIKNTKKQSSTQDLRIVIQKLCAWHPLTSHQLADILKRKDKKNLVRKYLSPMVMDGILKYVHPGGRNTPNQAYISEG